MAEVAICKYFVFTPIAAPPPVSRAIHLLLTSRGTNQKSLLLLCFVPTTIKLNGTQRALMTYKKLCTNFFFILKCFMRLLDTSKPKLIINRCKHLVSKKSRRNTTRPQNTNGKMNSNARNRWEIQSVIAAFDRKPQVFYAPTPRPPPPPVIVFKQKDKKSRPSKILPV